MHISYIQNMRLPTEKAHGYQIMKTCEAISTLNINIDLIVPDRKTLINQDPFLHYHINETFSISRHKVIDFTGTAPIFLKPLAFALERWTFFKYLKNNLPKDADIFYTRDAWLAPKIKQITNKPVFLELHAMPNQEQIKKLDKIDGVLCLTKWIENEIHGFLPNIKTTFLPDAVDLDVFDPTQTQEQSRNELGVPADEIMIAYGGRFSTMEQGKGLAMLDRVVTKLSEKFPKIKLYLIGGSSEEFTGLEKQKPSDTTICIPSVSRDKLAQYYRAANFLVMPFPNTHHYAHEMSPLKLFEYMASGTPIITSDLPSVREILNDESAYFFTADDIASFETTITKCINDIHAFNKALKAKELIFSYTWEKRAFNLLQFIQTK